MAIASIDRESPAYRALVHVPPCEDAGEHARLVIAACALSEPWSLEAVSRLIVDSRNDETDTAWPGLGPCPECE